MIGTGLSIERLAMTRRSVGGVSPPAPSFPYELTLSAWYDPSDLTTLFTDAAGTQPVAADGDPVGLMLDKSGNGHHMSQTTTTRRPVYRTSSGFHWLETDGVDDNLNNTGRLGLGSNPAITVSSAIRVLSTNLIVDRLLHIGDPDANGSLSCATGTGGFSWRHNNGSAVFDPTVLNTDLVATWQRPAGGTYASGRFWLNETESAQTGNSGATKTPTDTSAGVYLFARGNSTNNPIQTRFYGMVVTDSDADAQRQTITTYLGAKVGLTI